MLRAVPRPVIACASALLLLLPGAAVAQDPAKRTMAEINACMQQNLVDRGALRDLTMEIFDANGKSRALGLRLFWKPSKGGDTRVNLRLLKPLAIRGSGYLLVVSGGSEEVYFHLPSTERSLHVTGKNMSEPLWGSDFSYGEIKQVLGFIASGETKRTGDGRYAGRPTYVLETTTDEDITGYRRVVSHVDQESCVLMKSEFFVQDDKPRKALEADASTLLQADVFWTVLSYTMRDLAKGTKTKLGLSDISFNERLPEKLFKTDSFWADYQ